ncbi:unnamed protein product [Polarella glacialis]|uniref:Amine oxidase domain-containing protein n=1 Tax=Polarella glacialis TaxID=89957 RepID=A0A813KHA0_POLGL|nr:unnamed protein product [Polarella glacialis]
MLGKQVHARHLRVKRQTCMRLSLWLAGCMYILRSLLAESHCLAPSLAMASTSGPPVKVAVVGAGVAGLVCARELERAGFEVDVFEAAAQVGGRVRTEEVDGYQLDVGFQILIDSYPEVRRQLDLPALQLGAYAPGAVLASSGCLSVVANPLKCPLLLFQTLKSVLSWGILSSAADVLRLLRLALGWAVSDPYADLAKSDKAESTKVLFERLGFSSGIVQRFLRPFFEAIYVSPVEEQSAAMFVFVLRMLAFGSACLPARGMRAVPEQLAASLKRPVCLNTPVEAVEPKRLKHSGQWHDYSAVVAATEGPAACKLLGGLAEVRSTRSVTVYFGMAGPPPVKEPLIVLQSYGDLASEGCESRVVNIGFSSVAQPSYAPAGHSLAAVCVMGPRIEDEAWVRKEVEGMLGVDCASWRHLRTYDIACHQPVQLPLQEPDSAPIAIGGVFCCGDHRSSPTLDGAMRSGRRVAEHLQKVFLHDPVPN